MSVKILNDVWQHSTHKGSALLLLLAIADHADDNGIAYPSVPHLARKTRMTERNVQHALRRLVRSGDLTISPRYQDSGGHGPNTYLVKTFHQGGGEPPFTTLVNGLSPLLKPSEEKEDSDKNQSLSRTGTTPRPVREGFCVQTPKVLRQGERIKQERIARLHPPLSEEDWPGLPALLERFGLPLLPLNDNSWWNTLSYTCDVSMPTLETECARMAAWLDENRSRRPKTGWKRFVRRWLEKAYEQQRTQYARQKKEW